VTLLQVKDLAVTLDGRPILRNVSFDVEEGESIAIIGPNGSGKTILLKSILGIVPHEGDIRWSRKVALGYVPQKIEADRSMPLNIRNLLESKARVIARGAAEIDEVVAAVGLSKETLSTHIGSLSGGQFQRALIAFALLGKPDILLLDEPTASIDEPGEEQMYELIHRLQKQYGIAVVVVSHDLSFVYRYSDRVLCLNRTGLAYGPPRGVLTPELMHDLFGEHAFHHHDHQFGDQQ
jgi:zinc transport system ATP-binding protein